MKLFHISDLHLGKHVHGFSMLEEQEELLKQILQHVEEEKPDALLITGDVYDKPIPPAEAVQLWDVFLTRLSEWTHTYIIAGNHDSGIRLQFGRELLKQGKVFIRGNIENTVLYPECRYDDSGKVNLYLLPFFKPAHVNSLLQKETTSYQEAAEEMVKALQINPTERNILLAHQFVSWKGQAERSDSEMASVGGVDEIGAELFSEFDYVALGHLHSPQYIKMDQIRYAGSPMPYSFSEVRQEKGITVVELREKGNLAVSLIPLETKRKYREIKGSLAELLEAAKADDRREDYIRCILTDKEALFDPIGQMRSVYPNLMLLEREHMLQQSGQANAVMETEDMQPDALFAEFFEKQLGKELTQEQQEIVQSIWGRLEVLE